MAPACYRPLACGSVLRRIAAKATCRAFSDELRAAAGPCQYAVGLPGGAETLMKRLDAHASLRRGSCVVLKLDFRNAFNSTLRVAILSAVARLCAPLLPIASTLLPAEVCHRFYAADGVRDRAERL